VSSFLHSESRPQHPSACWDIDFDTVRILVITEGTDDDMLLFETLHEVFEDQWRDPEQWPDSAIEQEAARRLGKSPNAFYQQLSRMRKRIQRNIELFLFR
jgi:hypothetical protein